ncbi:MAG TPA: hypothetical protein ENG63_03510 [Candidatus Desulfofervidus auxilii]|uniref:Uncharacterized protein n=1 Tax=Desulfofervidus auxilii TaxID=1621989 RepID=A0A7C0U2E2_DESA2|nr:hypothetical protein [Candidatus Desulfofervidus auxilii]
MKIEGKALINYEMIDLSKVYKITIYPQKKKVYVNINEYSGKTSIDEIELKIESKIKKLYWR